MTEQPGALLLDLDGTLADTLPAMRRVYDEFLARFVRTGSDAEFDTLNGPALPEIVAALKARHDLGPDVHSLEHAYRALIRARYGTEARLSVGAESLLRAAARRHIRVAIVTSAESQIAEDFLRAHGLRSLVEQVVTAEGLARGKPDSAIYLRALTRLGVSADQACAVEDSENGMRAAIAAGIRVYAVGPNGLALAGVRGRVASLDELIPMLDGCRIVPLPADLRVILSSEQLLSLEIDARVDELWQVDQGEHPGRFDGSLLTFVSFDSPVLCGRFVKYRQFIAQRRDAELRSALAVVPLAVSGITICGTDIAFARRGSTTTQYPGWLELAPSGAISARHQLADGAIDHRAQLVEELSEETGIPAGEITRIDPVALVFDDNDGVVDIVSRIDVSPNARRISLASTSGHDGEYESFVWVGLANMSPFIERHHHEMVPTSRALCEHLLAGQ